MKIKASPPRAPTLEDVARAAGLSAMTVSRALNVPQQVRAQTLARVMEAVRATGYIPNALAGGLASRRSRLIAVVVPQINNAMFVDTIQALNDEMVRQGYQMLLCVSGYQAESEAEIVATLLSRRPDGIILTGIHHTPALKKMVLQAALPVVEIWDMTPTPIDMLVGFSHQQVGAEVGDYLIQRGYRKPALLWADDARAAQRRQGLEARLRRQQIAIVAQIAVPLPASMQGGREAFAALDDAAIDVVVCSSDTIAQGALIEAEARGRRVPQDVAVMGFGDLAFAAAHRPAITTVRIDRQAIGQQAVRALLARLAGDAVPQAVTDIGFEIIQRDSA